MLGIELAERLFVARRNEHRVVAEAAFTTWRPDQRTIDASVKGLGLTVVRPGDRQRADEMGSRSGVGLGRFGLAPDLFHRAHPVAIAVFILGPARGKNPRAAV